MANVSREDDKTPIIDKEEVENTGDFADGALSSAHDPPPQSQVLAQAQLSSRDHFSAVGYSNNIDGISTSSDGPPVTAVVRTPEPWALCGSRKRRVMSVIILTIVNLLNYMDRYTIAGVLGNVKDYYQIGFTKSGLLQTSFILSYMLLSPVFGYLGDRFNRKLLMAIGIFFWSCITFAGSFVGRDKFYAFLFIRALVGIGEASYSTIAPTIIADLFPVGPRTVALSVFYFAIPVGSGMGYIVASYVTKLTGNWQNALRVTPGFGVLCVFLILVVVREPPRGAADESTHLHSTSWSADLKYLVKNKSFMLSSAGFTCVAFVAGSLALWAPLYMYESVHVHPEDHSEASISFIFGVITVIAGILGVVISTLAARRLRLYISTADPLICAFGMIVCAPFLYVSICLSRYQTNVTWVCIFLAETALCLNWVLVADMLLYIVIPTRRSTAEAFQILMSHALGDAGSPFLIGVITDQISKSSLEHSEITDYISLQYALYVNCFVCVLGGGFFLATALFIKEDRRRTEHILKESEQQHSDSAVINGAPVAQADDTI